MKLASSQPPAPDHGRRLTSAEGRAGSEHLRLLRSGGIGMNEIHPFLLFIVSEKRAGMRHLERCPAHVGDAFSGITRKPPHMALQQAKPGASAFLAAFK